MALVPYVTEEEAEGKVRELYEDIKTALGIDFVPNLYRVMGSDPEYLSANWERVKAIMVAEGKLDRLTKEVIAVAVSAANGCRY